MSRKCYSSTSCRTPLSSRGVPFTRREDPSLLTFNRKGKNKWGEGLFHGPHLLPSDLGEGLFP